MKDFLKMLHLLIIPADFHLKHLYKVDKHLVAGQDVDVNGTIAPGFYLVGEPVCTACLVPSTTLTPYIQAGPSTYNTLTLFTFSQINARSTGAFPDKKRKLPDSQDVQAGASSQVRPTRPAFSQLYLTQSYRIGLVF